MTKTRIEKLLSQAIGDYIRQNISLIENNTFVSITSLEVTANLDIVSVYLGIIGLENEMPQEFLTKTMQKHHRLLRRYVAEKLRHQLRRIPAEIRFYLQ